MTHCDGWDRRPLCGVADLIMGQSPDSKFYSDEQVGLPFLQGCAEFGSRFPQHALYCSQSKKVAPAGSILFSVRAPVGKLNIADRDYIIGRGLAAILGSTVSQGYLEHYLRYEEPRFRVASQGSTFEAINSSELNRWPIDFPSDAAEQSKIAEILSTADQAIEHTEAMILKQQRIKTGLMQDLLTRGIDEHGNLRSEQTHEFKDSPLGRIPFGWSFQSVCDTGEVTIGRQLAPKYMKGNDRTPYLRVANVFDGWIDFSDILSMEFSAPEREKYYLTAGDVLLNEGQSIELVGRSALYRGPDNVFCFQNTLIRYRAYECMRADFAQTVFKWWLDTGVFRDVARQTTSVAHLGSDRFAGMLIVRPPGEEQDRIMKVLIPVEDVLVKLNKSSAKFRRIKTALMQDLLTGKRRVTGLLHQSGVASA
jgi:type I restriction enzyme S subunit